MPKNFKDFINKQDSLEKILFWVSLTMVVFATFVSSISSIVERLPFKSVLFCVLSCVSVVIIGIIAQASKKISICYTAMCFWMSGVILPIQFFMYGGLDSSMIIYFFGAVFLCALHSNIKIRRILVIFSIIAFEITFLLSWFHPEWITVIDAETTFIDYCFTFLLLSICLAGTTSYLISMYAENQKNKEILIKKLEYLAEKDPLTDLFNRRHLISYLSETIWNNRKNYYLYMYDIDNFKGINDTFGHPFGDIVLRKVADVGHAIEDLEKGERAVRYGGEEFIQLIYATSMEEAFKKAEFIRKNVSNIKFEGKMDMVVSISGGLLDCANPKINSLSKVLSSVDGLLYKAKSQGKNQTCFDL